MHGGEHELRKNLEAKGAKKLSRMKMCSEVSVEYIGSKQFTFLCAITLNGLGAVMRASSNGIIEAMVYGALVHPNL